MLLAAFRSLGTQCLTILLLLLALAGILAATGGVSQATAFLDVTLRGLKAPWVWTFGWGLHSFIRLSSSVLCLALLGVFRPTSAVAEAVSLIERSSSHRAAMASTIPTTLLGIILTAIYRVPLEGLAEILVFIGIISIYYVAGFLLFHFLLIIVAFHRLYEALSSVSFRRLFSPMHLENIVSYLALTTGLGLMAIYAGFRGTLTAGFRFPDPVWETFLTTPLILFLPATLFYNFYPRLVLRKIVQHKIFAQMSKLARSDKKDVELKEILLEIREAAAVNAQILPFVDHKSLPSYLVAILFALSILYNHDPEVGSFFRALIGVRVGAGD